MKRKSYFKFIRTVIEGKYMYSENHWCLIYSLWVKTYMLDFLKARYTLKYPGCVPLLFWPREDEGTGVTVYSLLNSPPPLCSFLSPTSTPVHLSFVLLITLLYNWWLTFLFILPRGCKPCLTHLYFPWCKTLRRTKMVRCDEIAAESKMAQILSLGN